MDKLNENLILFLHIICLVVFGVFLSQNIFSTSALAEDINRADIGNFNIYDNGDLNGQDGWSDVWNSLVIQDSAFFEGVKAVRNNFGFAGGAYKELPVDHLQAGVISFKLRIDSNSFSDNQDILGLYKGIGEDYIALIRFANDFEEKQNSLVMSVAGQMENSSLGEITQGEWHKILLGWRAEDFGLRLKIDNNEWTDWFSSQTSWSQDEPFGVKISLPDADKYGDFYLDDIKSFVGYEELVYDPVLLVDEITLPEEDAEIIIEPISAVEEDQEDVLEDSVDFVAEEEIETEPEMLEGSEQEPEPELKLDTVIDLLQHDAGDLTDYISADLEDLGTTTPAF